MSANTVTPTTIGTVTVMPTTCNVMVLILGLMLRQTRWLPAMKPMTPSATAETTGNATLAVATTDLARTPASAPTAR